jgi:hypothetical protein
MNFIQFKYNILDVGHFFNLHKSNMSSIMDKDHRERLLIFCHLVKCVSSAVHNVNGQHLGESDY